MTCITAKRNDPPMCITATQDPTPKPSRKRNKPMAKRKPGKVEEEEELDLGCFMPAKKQKQVKEKKKKQQRKNDEHFFMFKKFAKDAFNDPLTSTEYQLWSSAFTPTMSLLQYKHELSQLDMTYITYQSLLVTSKRDTEDTDTLTKNGMMAITDFACCSEYMVTWQDQWLTKLGWKVNPTGYNINTVSFSSAELMHSGIEWLGMLIKLSCRMLEFSSSLASLASSLASSAPS